MVRIELVRDDHVVASRDIVGRGTRYRLTISYRLNTRAGRYTLRVGPGRECPKNLYLEGRSANYIECDLCVALIPGLIGGLFAPGAE